MQTRFICTSKTGEASFTVHLEPVAHLAPPEVSRVDELRDAGASAATLAQIADAEAATALQGNVLHPDADTSFFAGFPYGSIVLSALTPKAAAEFEVGKETTVDFSRAR